MDKVVEAILKYGLLPTFLLIVIFLIVQDPNRAVKLKVIFVSPFFKLFRWFKREYVANQVANHLNTFFNMELPNDSLSFKINWVKTEDSPILKSGKFVIRMRREEDQAINILNATKYALPKIACPVFRHNISPSFATAIDFTFLHKLADKLGNHGKAVFKKYFLNPELENDPSISEILQKLIKIDKYGVFTSIFLNELDYVAEGLYANSDTKDKTHELNQFINYLYVLANREIGEDLGERLINFSDSFKVSVILLAKFQTANKKGLLPYLRRLNTNLEKGCDSIYIIAFPPAVEFLNKFQEVVDGNQRVSIEKVFVNGGKGFEEQNITLCICCLRRNKLFTNDSFVKRIEASNVKVGQLVEGTVLDCSLDEALITFSGLDGTIRKSECSWLSHFTCRDMLKIGEVKTFLVKSIDKSNGHISLSLKLPDEDPWQLLVLPKLNDEIVVVIVSRSNLEFKCVYSNTIEVHIPIDEISWFKLTDTELDKYLGRDLKVKTTKVSLEERIIECSLRQLEVDPWPQIHKSLKIGTEFNGRVHEITEHYVRVKIDNGLIGKIPKESLLKAGYEYASYRQNLVEGQGIDVVVTKVFINKRWIRLDLKRNLN